jgi:SAM-dependent methyltransferase
VAAFETSMAAGSAPIVEALRAHRAEVFGGAPLRWLDVGGGDGAVAAGVLPHAPGVVCDVYNLPAVEPLVRRRAADGGLEGRLGFVAGDFLREPLPRGYDVLSFVRVLHDWPAETARALLDAARAALAPGARILVTEELRTSDRLALQFFWTYFLLGVDACVSRLREVDWYLRALGEGGFVDVRVLEGAFDLVLARRGE